MKKFLALVLILCLCGMTAACSEAPDGPDPSGGEDYIELLTDKNFARGFNLFGPESRFHATDYWEQLFFESTADPFWKLATWGCFNNYFLDRDLTVTEEGKTYTYPKNPLNTVKEGDWYTISNPSVTVKANPTQGSLVLSLDSSQEYGKTPAYTDAPRLSSPRKSGEAWPHLLIEQNIVSSLTLDQVEEAVFSLDFNVSKVERLMSDEEFDSSLHTAQITWFVSIACINPMSQFYNQYIWFGVPIYDYRFPSMSESFHIDGGKEDATGMLIYGSPTEDYLPDGVEVGKRISFQHDFYPNMQRAFNVARERGLFADCTLADMRIINTNLGWELPGTFDATFELYGMSIQYRQKADETI